MGGVGCSDTTASQLINLIKDIKICKYDTTWLQQ